MIIDQRGTTAAHQPDAEPDGMPAQEVIHVVVTVLGKGAGAEKDDDAKGKQDVALRFVNADDSKLTTARLALVRAVRQVLVNGLTLLGVSAPEELS